MHALGGSLWRGCERKRRSSGLVAAMALYQLRLQLALRLLLRALLAKGAKAGARPRTHKTNRQRIGRAWCQGIFVTGGEPFLLPDIGEVLLACAAAAPTTVLTNGMLLVGRRLETLRTLPRDRIALQISLDSPTPDLHDRHRGKGTWARALRGIENARSAGFRVRLAATVSTDAEADAFRRFLDDRNIAAEDRVIRRIALRGFATDGIALARADLVPEITITADGVYWHPVGAEDEDLLISRDIFPLTGSFRRGASRARS